MEKSLLSQCDKFYDKLYSVGLNDQQETKYLQSKNSPEGINEYRERGAQIRSGIEQIEKDEKSNKHFYNKEKVSYEKKTADRQ